MAVPGSRPHYRLQPGPHGGLPGRVHDAQLRQLRRVHLADHAEVYPLFVRGKGAGVGAFSHWIFDLLVSLTTLSLVTWLGATHTFWLYAAISVMALAFVYFLVPETMGKSLERIEHELREHRFYPYQQRGLPADHQP